MVASLMPHQKLLNLCFQSRVKREKFFTEVIKEILFFSYLNPDARFFGILFVCVDDLVACSFLREQCVEVLKREITAECIEEK